MHASKNGRIAAAQMVSGSDLDENLKQAEQLLREAQRQQCSVVLLPENFALMGAKNIERYAECLEQKGPVLEFLEQMSRSLGLWIIAGSLPLRHGRNAERAAPGKVYPSCTVWDAEGRCLDRYDKMHLFDVDIDDEMGHYRESDQYMPGHEAVCVNTPWAQIGLSICYDLRFPELYRSLVNKGAEVLSVPAAFTYHTGQAHWETLLRARAIENQCFVVAANQGGQHGDKRQTWGHSCIIDPWGSILGGIDKPGADIVWADIDLSFLAQLRRTMPALDHRRI